MTFVTQESSTTCSIDSQPSRMLPQVRTGSACLGSCQIVPKRSRLHFRMKDDWKRPNNLSRFPKCAVTYGCFWAALQAKHLLPVSSGMPPFHANQCKSYECIVFVSVEADSQIQLCAEQAGLVFLLAFSRSSSPRLGLLYMSHCPRIHGRASNCPTRGKRHLCRLCTQLRDPSLGPWRAMSLRGLEGQPRERMWRKTKEDW